MSRRPSSTQARQPQAARRLSFEHWTQLKEWEQGEQMLERRRSQQVAQHDQDEQQQRDQPARRLLIGTGGRHEVGAAQQLVLYTGPAGINTSQRSTALRAEAHMCSVVCAALTTLFIVL